MSDRLNLQERLLGLSRKPLIGGKAFFILTLLGVEVPRRVRIGRGLRLAHGAVGLVIHEQTTIGDNVMIFGGVTIGRADQYLFRDQLRPGGGVTIGDGAVIGSGAKILFKSGDFITIGDGAVIGANAVVTRSVPSGEIWAGAPAVKVSANPNYASGAAARVRR